MNERGGDKKYQEFTREEIVAVRSNLMDIGFRVDPDHMPKIGARQIFETVCDMALSLLARSHVGTIAPQEPCTYCGESYPKPISYHHSEQECAENIELRRIEQQERGTWHNPDDLAEIEKLRACIGDCTPFLKDGETIAECIARNRADVDAVMGQLAAALRRAEKAESTPSATAPMMVSGICTDRALCVADRDLLAKAYALLWDGDAGPDGVSIATDIAKTLKQPHEMIIRRADGGDKNG